MRRQTIRKKKKRRWWRWFGPVEQNASSLRKELPLHHSVWNEVGTWSDTSSVATAFGPNYNRFWRSKLPNTCTIGVMICNVNIYWYILNYFDIQFVIIPSESLRVDSTQWLCRARNRQVESSFHGVSEKRWLQTALVGRGLSEGCETDTKPRSQRSQRSPVKSFVPKRKCSLPQHIALPNDWLLQLYRMCWWSVESVGFELWDRWYFPSWNTQRSSSLFARENFEAGAPADDVEEGWIQQLEFFKEEVMSSLRWISEERCWKNRTLIWFELICQYLSCFSMLFVFFGFAQTSFAHGPCHRRLGVAFDAALVLFLCPQLNSTQLASAWRSSNSSEHGVPRI